MKAISSLGVRSPWYDVITIIYGPHVDILYCIYADIVCESEKVKNVLV